MGTTTRVDIDDGPYLGLLYPGFDVYLADTLAVIDAGRFGESPADDPTYATRSRQHAQAWLSGETSAEYPF